MTGFEAFCQSNMPVIYGIYGLAFVVTGVVVLLEGARASRLLLARALPLLAAFALSHGLHEWIEMFQWIGWGSESVQVRAAVDGFSVSLLALSFVCLLAFAGRLGALLAPARAPVWSRLPLIGAGAYLLALALYRIFAGEAFFWPVADSFARYLLGMSGAALASWVMFVQRRAFHREGYGQVGGDLVGAALAFGWYALLQFIVPRTPYLPASVVNADTFLALVGMPVELARTGVVLMLAYFLIRVMRVFELESDRRIETLHRARFEAQEAAARELSVLYETTRSMGATLELDRLLADAIERLVTLVEPVRAGAIYLLAPHGGELVLRAAHARPGTLRDPACDAALARDALCRGDVCYHATADGLAVVALPLQAPRVTLGALCLAHDGPFANFAVMHTLARQLVIAIQNAQLYAEVQEKEEVRGRLLERAVAAQEEERRRLARDLHDQTGQTLTALGLGLSSLDGLIGSDAEAARRRVADLKEMGSVASADLRRFIADLRPALLDDLGLAAALREMARQVEERTGLRVETSVSGARRRLRPQAETVLYRIAQEALTNSVRHAQAAHARLALDFQPDAVVLSACDDGIGFSPAALFSATGKRRAWGLLGMQERAALVDGTLEIDSAPGQGTRLRARIPYRTTDLNDDDPPVDG